MLLNHTLLTILWIAYVILHSVLAGISLKARLRRKWGEKFRYYRLAYVLFAFIFFVFLIGFQLLMSSPMLYQSKGLIMIAGYVLGAGGLILMLVCIKKYFISLSGLRSIMEEKQDHRLMITGIHRYVRHPLYLGTFAFIWGMFLVFPLLSLLISNLIITIYTLIGIGFEEKKLILEFGEDYRKYQASVPRLIPAFKAKRKA